MKKSILIYSFLIFLLLSPISRAQWSVIGPPVASVFSLVAVSGSNVFVGTDSGVYRSTNNGQNWSLTFNSQPIHTLVTNDSNIFAGTDQSVFKSTNNGQNWTLTLNVPWATCLAISGSNVFAATAFGRVYRSMNNGQDWSLLPLITDGSPLVAVSGTIVFAGDANCGDPVCEGSIYRSTDNGDTWIELLSPGGIFSLAASGSIVFAGFDDDRLNHGTIRSTNFGETWMPSSDNYGYTFAFSGSNVFAGFGGTGVYLSTNNGQNWTQWNQGMGGATIHALVVNSTYIFAGTHFGSVWERLLSDTLVGLKGVGSPIPENYNLYQNYPNPFNPVTTIKFGIPKLSSIRLVIYDILGKEIAVLINEIFKAGEYKADWDASEYPSGVYFYKLTSENYSETKRMVLIK